MLLKILTKQALTSFIITAISILFFAGITTYLPGYATPLFILYVIVYMALFSLIPRRARRRTEAEVRGSLLLRVTPEESINTMSKDVELVNELKPQMIATLVIPFVSIGIWFALYSPLKSLLQSFVPGSDLHALFLQNLLLYTIIIALIRIISYLMMPKKMIIPLNGCEIYSDGIRSSNLALKFPLDGRRYRVEFNAKRGFVEIYDKETRYAYRLYTNNVEKVQSAIERYAGLR